MQLASSKNSTLTPTTSEVTLRYHDEVDWPHCHCQKEDEIKELKGNITTQMNYYYYSLTTTSYIYTLTSILQENSNLK